jgi:hypothetical protein
MTGEGLRRWATHLLSGKDNSTPDLARYAWAFANFAIVGTAAASVFKGLPVSLTELASALGIANTSAAVSTKLKESTEPDPPAGDVRPPEPQAGDTP